MTQINRIRCMESLLDELSAALHAPGFTPGQYKALRPAINELAAYYESPLWRQDFEDDCAGRLPKDLKRGVLSEDAVYNLLSEFDEFLNQD